MIQRYMRCMCYWIVVVLLQQYSVHSANVTCPYDLDSASGVVPPSCYANASYLATASSCCLYVQGAYSFASIRYANRTGTLFLPLPAATACTDALSSLLLSRGLVQPSLFGNCNFSGNSLAAGNHPCLLPSVSEVRTMVDLSNVTRLCVSPSVPDLSLDGEACTACQGAVYASNLALLNAIHADHDDYVQCGLAITIGIWTADPPSLARYGAYILCSMGLGGGPIIPPPPSPSLTDQPAVFMDAALELQISVVFLPFAP